jgi:16S rRNA (guanine(527)-N(7))-methyltransferase RsmG
MREEFITAIRRNHAAFAMALSDETIEKLADYFEIVMEANTLLHLVAPCSAEEFATRHVLESLTLLEFLPENSNFADVGAGAGLPSIPCLIARPDLNAVLIESKEKKAEFLKVAGQRLGFQERADVINKQFSEAGNQDVGFIMSRALDRFADNLPRLLKWGKHRRFLLFGGPSMKDALAKNNVRFQEKLMPLSQQRFLFIF